MKLTTLCTVQCIKISYRTVTAQHVYKDDVEEGQTAKLSATNNFAFTQPCITVTSVLKRRSDGTFMTTRARNKAAARNEIWDTKNLGKRDFVAIIYNGLKKESQNSPAKQWK